MTDQNNNENMLPVAQRVAPTRKSPSETENKLFAVLRSIPILKPGITEEHCRVYANGLNVIAVLAHMNYQRPEVQRVGAKRTQAEVEKLSDLAEKITIVMNSAHRETNELIEATLPEGSSLSQYKRVMNEVFRVLHQVSVEACELTAKGKKPTDRFATEITRGAAEAFTALTGRKPTIIVDPYAGDTDTKAGGPFLDFLKKVFAALGIKASAEYQAKQLRSNRT